MAIQRLDINKVSQQEARAFFEEHGCVIFSNTGLRNATKEMREELRDVVQFKYEQINPGTPVDVDSMFDKELVEIHKNDRSQGRPRSQQQQILDLHLRRARLR